MLKYVNRYKIFTIEDLSRIVEKIGIVGRVKKNVRFMPNILKMIKEVGLIVAILGLWW